MALTGPAGAFMFLIKPDQTANFEELIGKVKDGAAEQREPGPQAAGSPAGRCSRPPSRSGQNALYL